jgi:hypothetical protein
MISTSAVRWLICLAVALSIVVVSEIRKAVRRHTVPAHQEADSRPGKFTRHG